MFELHYIDSAGRQIESVLWEELEGSRYGAVQTQHATTARKLARKAAEHAEQAVQVSAGERPRFLILPDGRSMPPSGMTAPNPRDNCKRETNETCFCVACRADRRAARA